MIADQTQNADYRNFTQVILRDFMELPESPALKFKQGGSWQTISYRELGGIDIGRIDEDGWRRSIKACRTACTTTEDFRFEI